MYLVLEVCANGELQAYIRQNGPVSEHVGKCSRIHLSTSLYFFKMETP